MVVEAVVVDLLLLFLNGVGVVGLLPAENDLLSLLLLVLGFLPTSLHLRLLDCFVGSAEGGVAGSAEDVLAVVGGQDELGLDIAGLFLDLLDCTVGGLLLSLLLAHADTGDHGHGSDE